MLLYVDPGVGSLLWQVIVSAAVGATYAFRRTIGAVLRRLRKPPRDTR